MPDLQNLTIIGWREWIALPDLGVPAVKVKVDTGAKTSALHAVNVREVQRRGGAYVRFSVPPGEDEGGAGIEAEARLVEYRDIRSSSGHLERRPVIVTPVEVLGQHWMIELTLTNRDSMGFRMLLGREAIQQRFCVDPARSYLGNLGPQPSPALSNGPNVRRARSIPRGTP